MPRHKIYKPLTITDPQADTFEPREGHEVDVVEVEEDLCEDDTVAAWDSDEGYVELWVYDGRVRVMAKGGEPDRALDGSGPERRLYRLEERGPQEVSE